MRCTVRFSLSLLPLLLHCASLRPRRLCPTCVLSVAMVKDNTTALERAKKATTTAKGKKTTRGSSSRSGLPPGWIQGDWIRSTIWQEDLEDLAGMGLIVPGSWRLPGDKTEPQS